MVATHDGRVIVPVYDWVSFLGEYFKKIPNLKKFHHFAFSKETPGMVSCKESVYSPSIIHAAEESHCLPPICDSSSDS